MSLDLVEIWAHMNGLARTIAGFLMLMMVASVAVVVERSIAFLKVQSATRAFVAAAAQPLKDWKLNKLLEVAKKYNASPLAKLFEGMTARYLEGLSRGGSLTPVEMARGESARRLEQVSADLRRGCSVLASVGSVAPFVGLLGTVIGIMGAFGNIGASGSAGLGTVMTSISEALVETAFGLLVAIPAVLFFNYLTGRVGAMELSLQSSVSELLDEMENNYGHDSKHRRAEEAA
jgi:biopolymer transport protein ExbB